MANNQREQGLKFEALVPIASPEPTAVSSFNFHQDHFGSAFGIQLHDGTSPTAPVWDSDWNASLWRCSARTAWRSAIGPGTSAAAFGPMPMAPRGGGNANDVRPARSRSHGRIRPARCISPTGRFPETNCYVDLWIELLHALGIDPASAMAFACTVDFEGDQWTFFKPPPEESSGSTESTSTRCSSTGRWSITWSNNSRAGRTMIIEADSFYMPDRAATSYRREHVKSSIAIEAIDAAGERLRYFHGPGYYELSGEDYRGMFRLGRAFSEDVLPPYAELVRFDAGPRLKGGDLRRAAYEMLGRQLARRPERNPWLAFGERLVERSSANCWPARIPSITPMRSPRFASAGRHLKWPGVSSSGWRRSIVRPCERRRGSTRPPGERRESPSVQARPAAGF